MSLPTHFTIGQPVEANITCKYDEWRGVPLWIAGINAKLLTGETVYTVSESWPTQNIGHLSDPWMEDELCQRGPTPPCNVVTVDFPLVEIFIAGLGALFVVSIIAAGIQVFGL